MAREANSCGSVASAAGRFYVGTFYAFYDAWLRGSKTMSESGYVMKAIEDMCRARPSAMLQWSGQTLSEYA